MIVLGLLLMLACTALAVDAVVQNTATLHAIAFNQDVTQLSTGGVFIAGAVLGCLFALGLVMFAGGVGRATRRRRERRAVMRETTAETESLRAQNARLEQELSTRGTTTNDATSATPAYPVDPSETETTARSGRHRVGR